MLESLRILQKVIIVAFVATLALTIPAWFDVRSFPTAPVVGAPPLDANISGGLLVLLVGSLGVLFFSPASTLARLTLVVTYATFVCFDQSRLMPYLLQYVVMLLVLGWGIRKTPLVAESAWSLCQIILFSVYFWAGIQKINLSFVRHGFPWFIEPFLGVIPTELQEVALLGGLFVPFIETGLALLLLSEKRRRIGVVGLIAMHLFILLSLGPLGHNWNQAVWPWNIVMIVALWLLLRRPLRLVPLRHTVTVSSAVVLLYLLLPALNLVGLWDDYLSHSLYSRRAARGVMAIAAEDLSRLPRDLQAAVNRKSDGTLELSFVKYSMENLGLPIYPAERVFTAVGAEICRRYQLSAESATVVYGRPDRRSGEAAAVTLRCLGM